MLVIAFGTLYSTLALFRHWRFDSGYDLAIFDQAIWHMSRFETPASTVSGFANILGDHFHPILALLVPLYWVAPAAESIIIAQAVLVALSIVPVFRFVGDRVSRGSTVAICVAYGLFWGTQRVAVSDVHETAFAPLLIATGVLALDRRQWTRVWATGVMLLFVKEDLIPLVATFGLAMFARGQRKQGVAMAMSAVAFFVVVLTLIIPSFNNGVAWSTGQAFGAVFHRPWAAPFMLFDPPEKMRTVFNWLAPFAFLPLRSPWSLLLLPVAAERLLSSVPSHWQAGAHYSAPLAPILAMSAADGLARLSSRLRDATWRRRLQAGTVSFIVIAAAILPGHQPHWRLFTSRTYERLGSPVAARALAHIPEGASVVAQTPIAPHLSQRHEIYVLKAGAPDAEYVVVGAGLDSWPTGGPQEVSDLISQRRSAGYEEVFSEAGWIVLRRQR